MKRAEAIAKLRSVEPAYSSTRFPAASSALTSSWAVIMPFVTPFQASKSATGPVPAFPSTSRTTAGRTAGVLMVVPLAPRKRTGAGSAVSARSCSTSGSGLSTGSRTFARARDLWLCPVAARSSARLEALRTAEGRGLPQQLGAQIGRELDRLELLLVRIKRGRGGRDAMLARLSQSVDENTQVHALAILLGVKEIGEKFAARFGSILLPDFANSRQSPACGFGGDAVADGSVTMSKACPRPAMRDCARSWCGSPGSGCAINRGRHRRAGSMRRPIAGSPSSHWRASCWSPCRSIRHRRRRDRRCGAQGRCLGGKPASRQASHLTHS